VTEEELVALGVEEFTACVGVGVSELVAEGDDVLDSEAVGLGVDVAVSVTLIVGVIDTEIEGR